MPTLQLVDAATNTHLSGRFAPVHDEVDAVDLPVDGTIPTDLDGAYLRNGPNPEFTPLGSYTFPMEGDAMVHAVWIEGGKARYRNRYVHTQGMKAEQKAGRNLFGGMMTPTFVDTALLGPDPDPGWPFRLDPFINVVRHNGIYLALAEGLPPYQVTGELDTVGRYDFAGKLPTGMCAHPRVDPVTGEMITFRYDVQAPMLSWAVTGADGTVVRRETAVDGVDKPYMIHDFMITEHHVVLVVSPLVLDIDAMMTGGSVLAWHGEDGTRIAVIPRHGDDPVRWMHGDAFWAWHFANAHEVGDDIVFDLCWWNQPPLGSGRADLPARGGFARAHLRPSARTFDITHHDTQGCEFPRIDDRLVGRANRYATISRKSGKVALETGEFDQLARYDVDAGTCVSHDSDLVIGEVAFAPRTRGTDELDGYYLTYGTDVAVSRSWLLIWDAATFPGEPVARVALPQRVPNGLHGNWMPHQR